MAVAGLFIDVDNGSELLQLAVRRDVGDLSVAHRIWEMLRRTSRCVRACAFQRVDALRAGAVRARALRAPTPTPTPPMQAAQDQRGVSLYAGAGAEGDQHA